MYETELEDFTRAAEAYDIAADWYRGEDSNAYAKYSLICSQASGMTLKAATLDGHLENYAKAIEKFESVAQGSLDNNLTKWSVRDYLLKAGICILCSGDHVRAHQAFDERYQAWDMTFSGTREFKFLQVVFAL